MQPAAFVADEVIDWQDSCGVAASVIKVSVRDSPVAFVLGIEDLQRLFSRFGAVACVLLSLTAAAAVVDFHEPLSSGRAVEALNGHKLAGLDGATLRVVRIR